MNDSALDEQITELKKNPKVFNNLVKLGLTITNIENKFKNAITSTCDSIIKTSNKVTEKTEQIKNKLK